MLVRFTYKQIEKPSYCWKGADRTVQQADDDYSRCETFGHGSVVLIHLTDGTNTMVQEMRSSR